MNKNTLSKNGKSTNKQLTIGLIVMCVIMLVANLFMITLTYFSDVSKGNQLVTFGSVETSAYILNRDSTRSGVIDFDSNELISGGTAIRTLGVDVTGKNSCYLRLSGDFLVNIEGEWLSKVAYDHVNITINTTTNTNWILGGDGLYYCTKVINSGETITVDVTFEFTRSFGNLNANRDYKVILVVESCQSTGTELGTGASFDYTKWPLNI